MNKAYLNCVKKEITFALEDQKFTVDLTQGDLEDSWGSIKCRGKLYDTNFSWDEDDESPFFSITPVIYKVDNYGLTYSESDYLNSISYKVIVEKGESRDYFSHPFAGGFGSWAHTYGTMCTLTHDKSGSNGKIAFLEEMVNWAFEFEEKNEYTDWEQVQWDETLEQFLT